MNYASTAPARSFILVSAAKAKMSPVSSKPTAVVRFGHQTGALDFNQVIQQIKQNKGLEYYETPLGSSVNAKRIDSSFKNPRFPGEDAYGNGPMVLQRWEVNLPQTLIGAQRRSFMDAFTIYMPEQALGQWMHEYFKGDYLHAPEMGKVLQDKWMPGPSRWGGMLSDDLTLKLDAPERKRRDRRLYTNREMGIVKTVYERNPALALSVLAFQASFMGYLAQLSQAMGKSTVLSRAEIKHGQSVIEDLSKTWNSNNFVDNILPAVCLYYYKNHHADLTARPETQDFLQGMSFAFSNGMFHNNVKGPDGETRRFVCPAAGVVTQASALSLSDSESPETEKSTLKETMGIALAHIYESMVKQYSPGEILEIARPVLSGR